jgi:twitching motility protein PilT
VEQKTFNQLLAAAVKNGASDIHIKAGAPPALRIQGQLLPVKVPALSPDDARRIAAFLLAAGGYRGEVDEVRDWDTSYQLDEVGRFRVNIHRQKGHFATVLRVIPMNIPTLADLGLPQVIAKICEETRGLILVTGVTGSGKSSTLAAMVDIMNGSRRDHILTIEDPIEFIHRDKSSRITQREIGPDTESFAKGLRAALRQDPDTILIGEMRDAETIDIALKAAETGHLVLSTVHTTDAPRTIGRLIEVFPHEAHDGVRLRIAENLKATISQRLAPRAQGRGRVPVCEIMVNTLVVQEYIKDPSRTGEIKDYLQKNRDVYGTQTFDQHLTELYRSGAISLEVAKALATTPSDFERALAFD